MNKKNEELLALLQNSWDLIEYAKKQQWRVTYYALLLFAAIAGIITEFDIGSDAHARFFLTIVAWFGAIFADKTIFHSHESQCEARSRIKYCAERVSPVFWKAWKSPESFDVDNYDSEQEHRWYACALSSLNFAGALFVTVVALSR